VAGVRSVQAREEEQQYAEAPPRARYGPLHGCLVSCGSGGWLRALLREGPNLRLEWRRVVEEVFAGSLGLTVST
jgi:hypothetical protein